MEKRIKEIYDYWFSEIEQNPQQIRERNQMWFAKSDEMDTHIRKHFLDDHEMAKSGKLDDWFDTAKGRLMVIILLDQFSRNMFRDQAQAFANDALALKIAQEGVELEQDKQLGNFERMFMYLPFEHSEEEAMQVQSVMLFESLKNSVPEDLKKIFEGVYDYALRHKAIIDEFKRFPHRNKILGRESSPEEKIYLQTPGVGF